MTQLDWDSVPASAMGEGFSADLMAFSGGREVRVPFNGGWLNIVDGEHTEGSPQAIAADTPTLLTIDGEGAATNTEYRRGVDTDVWVNDTFCPRAVGESYLARVTMNCAKATSSATTIELDLGIGTDFATIIADERRPLTKGQGVTDKLSFTFPIFCLDTFGAHGGRFFVLASENVNIWNKAVFIQRLFTP